MITHQIRRWIHVCDLEYPLVLRHRMIQAPAVWGQNTRHALEGRHRSFCSVAFACSRSNLIADGFSGVLDAAYILNHSQKLATRKRTDNPRSTRRSCGIAVDNRRSELLLHFLPCHKYHTITSEEPSDQLGLYTETLLRNVHVRTVWLSAT
jgi:hypothetical protein